MLRERVKNFSLFAVGIPLVAHPVATPPSTSSPLLWGAALAGFFALAVLVIVSYRRRSGHPPTAVVPIPAPSTNGGMDNCVPVLLCNDGGSPAEEALRGIRTQLFALMRQRPLHHLVITSTGAGEGKSTVAANLALLTARAGHRVLLVDADVQHPQLHTIFGLPNEPGLSQLLHHSASNSMDVGVRQRFCQVTDVPNLSLLTAGTLPMEAAEVAGDIVRAAVTTFAWEDELVIYDAPPVLSVADPASLATLADGVLLVIRTGCYPREVLQQAYAVLEGVHAKLIGAVVNGTAPAVTLESAAPYSTPAV